MRSHQSEAAEETFAKQFENITADEMRCKCGECRLPIDEPEFKDWCWELQELRNELRFPFHFTSFYRCPAYNDSLYDGDGEHLDGPHTIGAADLAISFERMYQLIQSAMARGFGVGIKQHGEVGNRFIHIDNQGPRLWTYK